MKKKPYPNNKKQAITQSGKTFASISEYAKIVILAWMILIAAACKKDISEAIEKPAKTEIPIIKIPTNYPITDKLGAGYNVVNGEPGSVSATKGMVISIPALYDAWPDRIIIDKISKQATEVLAAEDAYSYTKSISGKLKVSSGFGLFKSSISYFDSLSYRSDLIYSSYNLYVRQNRIHINASADLLKNYLTREFKADLLTQSPAELISHYGTAVVVDLYTGGKFVALYRALTANSDRKSAASAGLSAAVKTWFDFDISGGQNSAAASTNTSQQLYYYTNGGNSAIPLIGEINLGNTVPNKIQLTSWISSVTPENSVMIDFGSTDGAISLADLIPDPTKAAAVRDYIRVYYQDNQLKMVAPPTVVYGYYDAVNADWAYSTKNEPTLDGRLSRSGPVFRAYTKKIEGTVPVYQFYSSALGDYMYTTNLGSIPAGYTNNGIVFYAYDTPNPGTVSVFEFLYSAKINKKIYYTHYYSTTNQLPGTQDWSYSRLAFYAYGL